LAQAGYYCKEKRLALTLRNLGYAKQTVETYQEVLRIDRQLYGNEHPKLKAIQKELAAISFPLHLPFLPSKSLYLSGGPSGLSSSTQAPNRVASNAPAEESAEPRRKKKRLN